MNFKVRRYEPLFLSPQHKFLPQSPYRRNKHSWKDRVNHEVTLCYNRIKEEAANQSKCSLPESNQMHQVKSLDGEGGVKSISTESNTATPTKQRLKLSSYQTLSPTQHRTDREKEIENYYSQRVQLLEEECAYLRKEFIGHCLKHHRTEFEPTSHSRRAG